MTEPIITTKEAVGIIGKIITHLWRPIIHWFIRRLDSISGRYYKSMEANLEQVLKYNQQWAVAYEQQKQYSLPNLAQKIQDQQIVSAFQDSILGEAELVRERWKENALYMGGGFLGTFLILYASEFWNDPESTRKIKQEIRKVDLVTILNSAIAKDFVDRWMQIEEPPSLDVLLNLMAGDSKLVIASPMDTAMWVESLIGSDYFEDKIPLSEVLSGFIKPMESADNSDI